MVGGVADLNNTTQAQLINIHAAAIKLLPPPIIHPLSFEHNDQSAEIKPQWTNERNEKLKRCAGKKNKKRFDTEGRGRRGGKNRSLYAPVLTRNTDEAPQ